MNTRTRFLIVFILLALAGASWYLLSHQTHPGAETEGEFLGSRACRDCHESFYQKWATSWHGLAMRPFTPEFARKSLTAQKEPLAVRDRTYMVEVSDRGGLVRERGPQGEKTYSIAHVLGGKNLCYFLTPTHGGRLQVLPVAYDTRIQEWYDTTLSMVRHFTDQNDDPVDWTDRLLTFNASCYNCHISQLSRNYSLETNSYETTWNEPGINCEACHGPGRKHVQVSVEAEGGVPDPLEIIVTRDFTHEQTNAMCAPCHAKMTPLTESFVPGERFFDHYNLTTMEDRDLYPDGRELGENYTFGPFLMSPCAASGQLDCMHCHTSSGRNRHTGKEADNACLPCHETLVREPAAHSFHAADSEGSRCVSCHMPMTTFARMRRHDHTLLAPTPAATVEFGSPNACNICHDDKDAKWADEWVRKWYPRDYQAPLLRRARLVALARKQDWSQLAQTIEYITSKDRNEVFASGLLRLLQSCPDPARWPAYFSALRDPSPLVRGSAAFALASCPDPRTTAALVDAAGDSFRVVRVQAAVALSQRPPGEMTQQDRQRAEKAFAEHLAFLECRPDDPLSHYNLGNHHQDRGDLEAAVRSYETALRLDGRLVPALVNLSMVHAKLGNSARAEAALADALRVDPESPEANYNLALLVAEQGRREEAQRCLHRALKADPRMAQAAYNLGVLLADEDPSQSILLCGQAAQLRPDQPRYAYTLAFYQHRAGQLQAAAATLESLLDRHPHHGDSLALLGSIYEQERRYEDALEIYRIALQIETLSPSLLAELAARAEALEKR